MSCCPFYSLFAPPHTFQGAYWGTAYAGYALIYTPGYYVHTWNLHNEDLIRPLYVSPTCSLGFDHTRNIQWLITLPADPHLRLLLFSHSAVDQNSHPDGLVQNICPHREIQKSVLGRLYDRHICSVSLGAPLHYPSKYAVPPTRGYLEILPSEQMLLTA